MRLQHELLLVVLLPPALLPPEPLLQHRLRLWRGGSQLCCSFVRRSRPQLCGPRAHLCGPRPHLCRSRSDLCRRSVVRHRPDLRRRPQLRLQHRLQQLRSSWLLPP
jgi:hypothetical protein